MSGSSTLPKISCLTISATRLILLKEAIRCYCDQTYPNRELVIVSNGHTGYQDAIERHVQTLGRSDIRLVRVTSSNETLGRLRNLSLDHASGDLLCQWDDDDLYHPERLAYQQALLDRSAAFACYLSDHLQFYVQRRHLYWIDWSYGGVLSERDQLVPGTVMMHRDTCLRYPETGSSAQTGEDNALRDCIYRHYQTANLHGSGYLYIYRYHGNNTLSHQHHQHITAFGSQESAFVTQREAMLRAALPYYQLPMPYLVKSRGGQTVFAYNE